MITIKQLKDFKKYPSTYFEDTREARIEHMDKVIGRIEKEKEWWDLEDPNNYPPSTVNICPLTNIKIIRSGMCYEGEMWARKFNQIEGQIPRLLETPIHKFTQRAFFYTPVIDMDTAERRHPLMLKDKVFAFNMGEGLDQIFQTQREIRYFIPKSSWRIYMTTRGLRCVEMGVRSTPLGYIKALYLTESVDTGGSKWDPWNLSSARSLNRIYAAVMPQGETEDAKDMVIPLYTPPCFMAFMDRPNMRWINAFPILDVQGERDKNAFKDAEEFHDKAIFSTMTEERWDFAWSELRKRMSSVRGEVRTAIEEWVGDYYKESKL